MTLTDPYSAHPTVSINASTRDRDVIEALRHRLALSGLAARLVVSSGSTEDAPSDVVVVVWSPESVHSSLVLREASEARQAGVALVPVTIAGLKIIPNEFQDLQTLDLSGWKGDPTDPRLDVLVRTVTGLARSAVPGEQEPGPRVVSSTTVLLGYAESVARARGSAVVDGVDVLLAVLISVGRKGANYRATTALHDAVPEPRGPRIAAAGSAVAVRLDSIPSSVGVAATVPQVSVIMARATDLAARLRAPEIRPHHLAAVAVAEPGPPEEVLHALEVSQATLRRELRRAISRRWPDEPAKQWDVELGPEALPSTAELSTSALGLLRGAVAEAGDGPVAARHVVLAALRRPTADRHDVAAGLVDQLAALRGTTGDELADELTVSLGLPPYRERRLNSKALAARTGVPELLSQATAILARFGFTRAGRGRHLLAAAVAGPLPPRLLEEVGITVDQLRRQLADSIHEWVPDEPRQLWQELLLPRLLLAGRQTSDHVDPDQGIPQDRDDLGVSTYVAMLASLITRKDTPLPLSVGLFGEWGSGKSYFMGLLRSRIDGYRAEPGDVYHHEVAHIVFNAWTYADADLWASLGDTIFTKLAAYGDPPEQKLADQQADLRAALQSTKAQAAELESARRRADEEASRLRIEVEKRGDTCARSAGALLDAATKVFRSHATGGDLDQALRRLGATDAMDQARLLADEVNGVHEDARIWRSALTGRWGFTAAALAVAGLLAVAASGWAADWLARWISGAGLGVVTAALAMTVAGLARVRAGMRSLSRIAHDIRKEQVEKTERSLEVPLRDLRRAEAAGSRAGSAGRSPRPRRRTRPRTRRPRSRPAALQLPRPARGEHRLPQPPEPGVHDPARLHRTRAADEDVGERPFIRAAPPRARPHRALHRRPGPLHTPTGGAGPAGRPPAAGHRSVRGRGRGRPAVAAALAARPVEHHSRDRRARLAVEPPGLPREDLQHPVRASRHEPGRLRGDDPAPPGHPGPSASAAPGPDVPDVQEPTEQRPDADARAGAMPEQTAAEDDSAVRGVSAVEIDVTPLQPAEERFLEALAPLVRSPRSATRMLNIYRMLRSTADLGEASRFLGDSHGRGGEFQAVALLLAVQTGAPDCFGRLMDAPRGPAPDQPGGLRARSDDGNWRDLLTGLAPRRVDDGWRNDLGDVVGGEETEWNRLVVALSPATDLVTLDDLAALRAWAPHVGRFSFHLC